MVDLSHLRNNRKVITATLAGVAVVAISVGVGVGITSEKNEALTLDSTPTVADYDEQIDDKESFLSVEEPEEDILDEIPESDGEDEIDMVKSSRYGHTTYTTSNPTPSLLKCPYPSWSAKGGKVKGFKSGKSKSSKSKSSKSKAAKASGLASGKASKEIDLAATEPAATEWSANNNWGPSTEWSANNNWGSSTEWSANKGSSKVGKVEKGSEWTSSYWSHGNSWSRRQRKFVVLSLILSI